MDNPNVDPNAALKKFAFVFALICLAYTDFNVFWWLGQYFFGRSFAREENLLPAFIFSVPGTVLSVVFVGAD
jgi:hypothetical protein